VIRVNLMPTKRARGGTAQGGNLWIIAFLGAMLFEGAALAVVHLQRTGALEQIQRRNADARGRIDLIKREVADHDAIKAELEDIHARDEVIAKLHASRTGPVYVMMELSKILSPGQMPTTDPDRLAQIQRNNPLQAPNLRWDSRRLWVTSFKEEDREVTITGAARGHDDVAEFLKRLLLSDYFTDEQLRKTESVEDHDTGLTNVTFEIRTRVRYR
jgi:type IV pilus assembly protein PilN